MHRTALPEESKLKAWIAAAASMTVGIVAAAPAAADESEFFNLLDSQYLRQHYTSWASSKAKEDRVLRAICVGVVVAAAAIGASSTAAAEPSLVAGAGGIATSPGPFLECPAGTYQGSSGDCVESPDSSTSNATAICRDGSDSHSEHRAGTCSGHGGVSQWCPCGGLASGQSNAAASPGNDPDSVYVSYENSHGVPILIDTPDIRQAMRSFAMDKICGPLNNGAIAAQVAQPLLDQGDTRNSAQTDMTGAVVAYCPSYLGPVNAYWQSNS